LNIDRIGRQRIDTVDENAMVMAHELNQPLCSMLNYVEECKARLRTDQLDRNELSEVIETIGQLAIRASEITRRVRSLGKTLPELRSMVDVNQIVRKIVTLMQGDLRWHQTRLELQLNTSPIVVEADPIQLQQVLVNLTCNALDSMQDTLPAERWISIRTSRPETREILVEMRDHGLGISPNCIDQVFQSYFTDKSHGTGLGLSICRQIVESHGGRIWAENRSEGGAVVRFTLQSHSS
jgi:two-component system sensor kinase FixL